MYAIFSVKKGNIGKADEILKDDIVSRQSIAIRDASALGIDSENRYILIEGNEQAIKRAEELFKGKKVSEEAQKEEVREEEVGKIGGLFKEIGKKENKKTAKQIYDKIKKEEDAVAEGVGFVFGE